MEMNNKECFSDDLEALLFLSMKAFGDKVLLWTTLAGGWQQFDWSSSVLLGKNVCCHGLRFGNSGLSNRGRRRGKDREILTIEKNKRKACVAWCLFYRHV
ncbi:uncharacterized protein LOC114579830 isoform X2 [Dendrobium catenatum]|uniref:uncharacterized protein LOC114579830 isoform X2 n=1 Tax=Dendrobium catenatum TaxID=906689 RepID=UPI00109EE45F|nr:uncharacterized protein LOC114579830 isoform X2 [Dendrobium catenatum]